MRTPPLALPLLVCAALAGCTGCSAESEVTDGTPAPDGVALAPPSGKSEESGESIVHHQYGYPGTWWRDDGSTPDFERDLETCRRDSAAARAAAARATAAWAASPPRARSAATATPRFSAVSTASS